MQSAQDQRPTHYLNFGILLREAMAAAERCFAASGGRKRKPGGNQGLVSVVFATASLEAFLNDLPILLTSADLVQNHVPQLAGLKQALEIAEECRAKTKYKYQVAKKVLTGSLFDQGKSPFQDFALLVDARNSLVHMRPEEVPPLGEWSTTAKKFSSRSILSEDYPKTNPHFMAALDTPAVALWACDTASSMIADILRSLPLSALREVLEMEKRKTEQEPL